MMDTCKEFLAPKRFGIVAYVCVIVHFLCGLAFTVIVATLRANENGKFSCSVRDKASTTYQKKVDQACLARYDQVYNSPLPLYGFVLLSFGLTVLISVIYSLVAWKRVDEIQSNLEQQADYEDEENNPGQNRRTVFVFYSYFAHLVLRALLGIIFTVLQYTYFYPNGFDFKFQCSLPSTILSSNDINAPETGSHNRTSVTCENSASSEKGLSSILVSVINGGVAVAILVEILYLLPRLPILNGYSEVDWSSDHQFVTVHFLRKRYVPVEFQLPRIECIDFYKQQVLKRRLAPDINYKQKTGLDDLYIDVAIYTERARHEFSKKIVDRHEIYDVHTEIPPAAILLERIKDLFYPNEDTKGEYPRSILAIGRPGIGKTVLTQKITRDWANAIDEYYTDKIVFFFKFRWFNENITKLRNISLKTFLRYGTGLSIEKFESIYEEMMKKPQKAILIFDGLDEFHGDHISCLEQSRMIPNDPKTRMSAMNLFVKLTLGDLLKGATVLVSSRPTADDFYSKLDFDRGVEIIGFTRDKMKEYVNKFCDDDDTRKFEQKIWNHIESSPELLNLCYIPVNSFIVCVTLSGCLSDPSNDTGALPTTLTELYQTAVEHVEKYHNRNEDQSPMKHEMLTKLQRLAFTGMKNGQLVFNQGLVDKEMKKSGLLNSLSNPIFPLQTQFCFVHLTIQEFLAAWHVTDTFTPAKIKEFISNHVESGKWHLVLQFIAGLLGKKIAMFDEKYYDCLLVFAKSFKEDNGEILVWPFQHNEFIIKCLKEVNNEDISENVFETNSFVDDANLHFLVGDMPAIMDRNVFTFALKRMKNVVILDIFQPNAAEFERILDILQKRCISKLLVDLNFTSKSNLEDLFSALMNLDCSLNHNHSGLTSLQLLCPSMADTAPLNMCKFFENGYADQLEVFVLRIRSINFSFISKLFVAFSNGYCTKLTKLGLQAVKLSDETVLWDTLGEGFCNLTDLLIGNLLTCRGIPSFCKALQDERCQLINLSLTCNEVNDEGLRILCEEALTKKHCKLTSLKLDQCSLSNDCIPSLVKALLNKDCKLISLSLDNNPIGDKGVAMLFKDALSSKSCILTELSLQHCLLTDLCVPSLCMTLRDGECALKRLKLAGNKFTENSKTWVRNQINHESCKARGLEISFEKYI